MNTRISLKGLTKMRYLILLTLVITINSWALLFSENPAELNIPQSSGGIDDFIDQENNFIEISTDPLGLDAPYGRYNFISDLSPAYLVINDSLRHIIDKAILKTFQNNPDILRQTFPLQNSKGVGDLRSALIFLVKSPYYQKGEIKVSPEFWESIDKEEQELYETALRVFSNLSKSDKEYIRNFDTLAVEPDIKDWPKFSDIYWAQALVREKKILEEKEKEIDTSSVEDYLGEIERAVISSIAGFNPETDRVSLLSSEFTEQAIKDFHTRIEYWLRAQECIPDEIFDIVKSKAIELFDSLELNKGLYPESPWYGEFADIYRILGGEIPTKIEPGRFSDYTDWGEDIYKRVWDISTYIEKVDSEFGTLIKGPDMTLEQLKDKVEKIGPAIVGLNSAGSKEYIKVTEIGKESLKYQDSSGNIHIMDLEAEFLPQWDKFVYIPEEKTEHAQLISDFDFNPESYPLVKGYGQWTINEFDDLDSEIGINVNIPLTDSLPYFYTKYRVGGEETCKYAGYFQTGLWLTFNDEIKQKLLRGTALVFDYYISDYSKIKYLKVELKEDESGTKISEFIIPAEQLNLGNWNTFKIPIHYYLPGTLSLTIGVIGSYPSHYTDEDHFIAIDRIYVE